MLLRYPKSRVKRMLEVIKLNAENVTKPLVTFSIVDVDDGEFCVLNVVVVAKNSSAIILQI
jgi:hypothetical protein